MDDELEQTVHLIRRGKVTTDDRDQTVWEGPVEEVELELVSTGTLKRALESNDADDAGGASPRDSGFDPYNSN